VLGFLAVAGKWLLPGFKLLKASKFLLTSGTMLLSVWYYAQMYGWTYAAGFVFAILIHELGHVYFAWREGIPVSAPVFIPGFGALILLKDNLKSAYSDAVIGIGGPLFGALCAVAYWGLYFVTGNPLFIALAYTAFLLNLFNMAPIYPLDGGRIVSCVSPYLLIIGYVMLIAATVTGFIRNPLVYILVIMSVPHVWTRLRNRDEDVHPVPTTKNQRLGMGLAYVSLAALLAWGMGHTHLTDPALRRELMRREQRVVDPNTAPVQ